MSNIATSSGQSTRRIAAQPACAAGAWPRTRAPSPRGRAGTAATEFALAVPLLMLVALGSCDFGRIAHAYLAVTNAARTGAETGASHGFTEHTRAAWEAGIRQAVVDELASIADFDEAEMTFELTTTDDTDDLTRVEIDLSYPFRTSVDWPLLPAEVVLRHHVEFRQFR